MNSIISLYSYLILNAAIAIGYVGMRTILSLPTFKKNMLQAQRLNFARFSFISIIGIFFIIPIILPMLSIVPHSQFELKPLLTSASMNFMPVHKMKDVLINDGHFYRESSLQIYLYSFLIIGVMLHFAVYFYHLYRLKQLAKNSFVNYKGKKLVILLNEHSDIPFCWSFWQKHYVVIPYQFVERKMDMQVALRHEFQHIRQGDTKWLHGLAFLRAFCFWNPALILWNQYLNDLQEFACDEALMLRKSISPNAYARCLLNTISVSSKSKLLPKGVLGMHKNSKSFLYQRVEMIFQYRAIKNKMAIMLAYFISCFISVTAAYAFNGNAANEAITLKDLKDTVAHLHLDKNFHVATNADVLNEINSIRLSDLATKYLQASMQRMSHYKPIIEAELKKNNMPTDLLIIPLVESGFQPLTQDKNIVKAAGIWQIIPSTASRLGLIVNAKQDDRLDTLQSTSAAISYLKSLHAQFNDWKLAFVGYEIGEDATMQLIKETGSSDAWVLANSSKAPPSLKKALTMFDAAFIIMHKPSLISMKG